MTTNAPSIVRMSPLLRQQHGVITTAQAERLEISRATLHRMVKRGELERLRPGVYRAAMWPPSWQQAWWGRLLTVGEDTAASHRAACWLHRLEHTGAGRRPSLELTCPRATDVRLTDVTVHTAKSMRPSDVVDVGGLKATSVAWTLCASAWRLRVDRTESALDAAIASGKTTFDEFAKVAMRFRFCPGMSVLREVLERHLPAVRMARSEGERRFYRWVVRAGLPEPVLDYHVIDSRGRDRYLDAAWPRWWVSAEIDLYDGHLRALGRGADGRRQNALITDWTVLRFDEIDMRFGRDQVIEDVTRALAAAGAPV